MSGGVLILHLPDGPGEIRSQRLAEGRIVDGTEGVAGDRVVAIAPAEAVALRRAEIGALAPAQARGAARLIAAEHSLTPAEQLHVALGAAADGQRRMIGAVAAGRMAAWMTALAEAGHDPDAIIPHRCCCRSRSRVLCGETLAAGRWCAGWKAALPMSRALPMR